MQSINLPAEPGLTMEEIKNKVKGIFRPNNNVHVDAQPETDIVAETPATVVTAADQLTRVVKLIYESCCGCGCRDVTVSRRVQWDSPLQDGDFITELHDTDEY